MMHMSLYSLNKPSQETIDLILACLDDDKVRSKLSERIRVEMDSQRTKYNGDMQSYQSLTAGTVNLQVQHAASGYDVYGNTILRSNYGPGTKSAYQKMKNQIKTRNQYMGARGTEKPFLNRGKTKYQ